MKVDLQVENFRRFFDYKMMDLSQSQRDRLPSYFLSKLFKKDGSLTAHSLTFLEQLYVLTQAQISNIYIHLEDINNGIGVIEYEKFKDKIKERKIDLPQADEYLSHGSMVLAGKDVANWLNLMNALSNSGAMNYALKLKNTPASKIPSREKEFVYLCQLLATYEANKKKMTRRDGIDSPDLYVLFYLCDGTERSGAYIHKHAFVDAINSSRLTILKSLRKLIAKGYIKKTGSTLKAAYQITSAGKSAVADIMKKYILH